jgi:hypothetical protein
LISVIVDSGQGSGHDNIDANDPKVTIRLINQPAAIRLDDMRAMRQGAARMTLRCNNESSQ